MKIGEIIMFLLLVDGVSIMTYHDFVLNAIERETLEFYSKKRKLIESCIVGGIVGTIVTFLSIYFF